MILKIGKNYYESKIMAVSYSAINDCLDEKDALSDVIVLERDVNNNITYISTNTYKLNKLSVKLSQNFLKYVSKKFEQKIDVPLGAFTGINILSGFGKSIKMDLIVITSVKCEFYSEFSEAGINQTRHVMKLFVTPKAKIISQKKTYVQETKVEIILFDSLIIGKVPDTYLKGEILGNSLSKNN